MEQTQQKNAVRTAPPSTTSTPVEFLLELPSEGKMVDGRISGRVSEHVCSEGKRKRQKEGRERGGRMERRGVGGVVALASISRSEGGHAYL